MLAGSETTAAITRTGAIIRSTSLGESRLSSSHKPAAPAGDDFVPAPLNRPHDLAGDLVGRLRRGSPQGRPCVFQQHVEVFGLRRAGRDDQHVDAQPRQLRPHRFAETVQRKLARRVLALVRRSRARRGSSRC